MRNVTADFTRLDQADHGVEVRTVDVNLTAELVCNLADLAHGFFEHAVCRRIGDHASRQTVARFFCLRAEILNVDIAVFCGLHHDHIHATHLRRSRVRAVCRDRDQTDVTLRVAVGLVVGHDGQKARIFALRARVRLHRHRVIACHDAELFAEISDHLLVTRRLINRGKWVQERKLWPRNRHHLRRCVQLHGARPQRDHCPIKRKIAIRESTHVAHHFRLSAVHVENRVGEVIRRAAQILGDFIMMREVFVLCVNAKGTPDRFNCRTTGAFIEADTNLGFANFA